MSPDTPKTRRGCFLLWGSVLFLAVFFYQAVIVAALEPWIALPGVPGGVMSSTLILWVFSLLHAAYLLGWRHALAFFAISAVISWLFEQVGVETGAIYGPYHYTDQLGVKLGHVPLLIPIAWFMMIYPSYVIANLVADGRAAGTRGGGLRLLWLAALGAAVMTAWDVAMDPIMSGLRMQAWVWEEGGPYFGVPLQNFTGWMLTTLAVYGVYRVFERRSAPRPSGRTARWIELLPAAAYATMAAAYLLLETPGDLKLVTAFVMGIPALAAFGRAA
jgi:putative membrane protein